MWALKSVALHCFALLQVHVPGLAWPAKFSVVLTDRGVDLLWCCEHESLLEHPSRRPAIVATQAAFFSRALGAAPSAAAQLQTMELLQCMNAASQSELSLSNQ